jgi:hypothetical protein
MGVSLTTGHGRIRAFLALVLAFTLAGGLVACGGGGSSDTLSKSDYEAKVKGIGNDLKTSFDALQGNTKDIGELETKVAAAQGKLQSASNQLKSLKPPKDVAADNTKLATALSALAGVFNNMKQALASKDVSKIQQLAQQIQTSPAVQNAKSATDDLKKKGYDIGVLGQ